MDLHAYTRSISDLLSVNKKYVVPRFQREYSWEREHVTELWHDLIASLTIDKDTIRNTEYFIGALVLIGEDSKFEMQIVDGQQRLTTITILLSAIAQTFMDLGVKDAAEGIQYQFIEGKDDRNKAYFKLVNENPKPFFQNCVQNLKKKSDGPSSEEEKLLLDAYSEFCSRLTYGSINRDVKNFSKIGGSQKARHIAFLEAMRNQVLRYLKVIYITVAEEDDAYTIFETLNARGLSLSAVDLIKNVIFKELNQEHPDDFAKTEWNKLKKILSSRDEKINIDTFFRHFWISKYGYVSEGRIYKSFRSLMRMGSINCEDFLAELIENAGIYVTVTSPAPEDWKLQDEKPLYYSLQCFSLFKVTQVRPLLLALIRAYRSKKISVTQLRSTVLNLEKFHFVFTAICSSRASGIDGKYSKAARDVEAATKSNAGKQLAVIRQFLLDKRPKEGVFETNFGKLWYSANQTKDKKLIQYFWKRMEENEQSTDELTTFNITLEHIAPQKDKTNKSWVGCMGNLLPLDKKINEISDALSLSDKIEKYKKSNLKSVARFCKDNSGHSKWTEALAKQRTEKLARHAYRKVWDIT